jgi:predicted AlkP superfamily pyrophosphatase or phosphodiesterase
MKVLLISVDGVRPDALAQMESAEKVLALGASSMNAASVIPPVTLPCHMTMFHSVDPDRHGTMTNTYMPQVRPVQGLCEVLKASGKTSAMFYNWEQLRDLARPGSLAYSLMIKGRHEDTAASPVVTYRQSNDAVTTAAIECMQKKGPDFVFLYLAFSDDAGHKYGWMSPEYFDALENSLQNIRRVLEEKPEEYTVLITSDHGGHGRTHGMDIPEDMRIPIAAFGPDFAPGSQLPDPNLKDLAPTICALLGVAPNEEWEGRSFVPERGV